MADDPTGFDERALATVRAVGQRFPTLDSVLAEIAHLSAVLTLPKGAIHVVSDVHGEFKKLKHIINNASGSLRPLVEQTFGDRLTGDQKRRLLNLLFYPRETYAYLAPELADEPARRAFLLHNVRLELELVRALARGRSARGVDAVLPRPFEGLFRELCATVPGARAEGYLEALLEPFVREGKDLELLRLMAHLVRNLSVYELIVAGDLGDRGPRIDKVIDYVMRQPNVAITWGNHDASWIGACLGQEACIATVLRISLRYRRLSQLEEGYGIPVAPLEKLARTVYGDDDAERFPCKGEGLRDPLLMARMQKAMAIIQFKLEGQVSRRHPEWDLEHRNLLHRIDRATSTVEIDGERHPMLDMRLPTLDPADPYALSPEERACIDRLRQSFLESQVLWQQIQYVVKRGAAHLVRDDAVIFHGCVPVDAAGELLEMPIGDRRYRGRALFEAVTLAVQRALRDKAPADLDLCWYLWTGPLSPMFGKDRMATFETYFVADPKTHGESKNPYFKWINDPAFCRRICEELGVDPARGLIVNGHVPVRVEKGESPLKKSGHAVTIDGAFSEAYGDRGYTLVLDPARSYLAEHHHFESVTDAITTGADIIPTIQDVQVFDRPRTVGDTEKGREIRHELALLELLARAYRENRIPEQLSD